MTMAIAGASGFVGRALTVRLLESNHDVLALHRSAKSAVASERSVVVDLGDVAATARALTDVDVAYYLIHSMAVRLVSCCAATDGVPEMRGWVTASTRAPFNRSPPFVPVVCQVSSIGSYSDHFTELCSIG